MKKRQEKQEDYIQIVWEIRKWYEKTIYVCGWIFAFSFFIGFISALLDI